MKFKTITPSADKIQKIAEFLNVSTEYLMTGEEKTEDKKYYNHSGYPGGLRERTAKEMVNSYPEEMVERAIKGMLPHGRLGRAMGKKLFVYRGSDHKHAAQKPIAVEVK